MRSRRRRTVTEACGPWQRLPGHPLPCARKSCGGGTPPQERCASVGLHILPIPVGRISGSPELPRTPRRQRLSAPVSSLWSPWASYRRWNFGFAGSLGRARVDVFLPRGVSASCLRDGSKPPFACSLVLMSVLMIPKKPQGGCSPLVRPRFWWRAGRSGSPRLRLCCCSHRGRQPCCLTQTRQTWCV